jgi:GPH family glycoside/pentoside/hexuronide:cation symporter
MGISLGIAFSNFALGAAGYNVDLSEQPESVLLTLRLFISLLPAVVLLLSFLVMHRYPISRERHAEIRAQINTRKSE